MHRPSFHGPHMPCPPPCLHASENPGRQRTPPSTHAVACPHIRASQPPGRVSRPVTTGSDRRLGRVPAGPKVPTDAGGTAGTDNKLALDRKSRGVPRLALVSAQRTAKYASGGEGAATTRDMISHPIHVYAHSSDAGARCTQYGPSQMPTITNTTTNNQPRQKTTAAALWCRNTPQGRA